MSIEAGTGVAAHAPVPGERARRHVDRSIAPDALWHFLEHQGRRFRTTLRPTIVNGLLAPVLFLFTVGFGLGSQIDDPAALGTSDYQSFVGPGVLATIAVMQASSQSLWPTLGAIKWEGTYQTALTTPLTAAELATGHIMWIATRVLVGAIMYVSVLALFGIATEWTTLLAPIVAALTAASFAAPISAWVATKDDDYAFSVVQRVAITPVFLFSGAFFPLDQIPAVVAWIVRVLPAWHGVQVCRGLIIGGLDTLAMLGHLGWILVWIFCGWFWATRTFTNRLST